MLFRPRAGLFVPAIAVLLAACSSDRRGSSSEAGETAASAPTVIATVVHRDTRVGAPTFAWFHRREIGAQPFESVEGATLAAVRSLKRSLALDGDAVAALGDPQVDAADSATLVRFRQRVLGTEVFRASLTVALRADFEPIAASGLVMQSLAGSERPFTIGSEAAVAAAVNELTGTHPTLVREADKEDYQRYSAAGLTEPARTKRVFFPLPTKGDTQARLEPAHYIEVQVARGPARSFVVSAIDGRLLFENNLVRQEARTYRVYADATTKIPFDGPQGNAYAPHPTGQNDHIKPEWVPSQLVTLENFPFSKNDPWLPPGVNKSMGNNVYAYADLDEPDGFKETTDLEAVGTGAIFDFAYDTNASPGSTKASQQASVTQLFYVLNFMHDWFYDAGFDEKSGNHQTDNFQRGGRGGDELWAETQDYSGRNNADALVPSDGSSPRIQMYVFAGTSNAKITVNSPAAIAGDKSVGVTGGFGKDLFDITGSVVLGVDGVGGDVNDGCEELSAAAGKILFVHRGTCSFLQKAQNAQAAGATALIITNLANSTDPNVAPFMGGTAQGVTIPVLSLSAADGQALEAALAQAPSVTLKREGGVDLDGALDTAIVAHEWGHVLSGRLVSDGNGLNTNQAGGLGEGWGDFTALLLEARPDDPGTFGGTYANGSYAMSGGGDDIYFGTRRLPYSIDLAKNPLTFKHIQNGVPLPSEAAISFGEEGGSNAEVHNTGEVWASMLWECYVALLRDPRFTFDKAQERMKRVLVASLKLTPPDPTLLEARDAVIAAALAIDPKDATLFWQAFAKRGAGAGAEGPGKDSPTNLGVKESFTAGNAAIVTDAVLRDDVITCDHDNILDEGEVATIELTVKNAGSGVLEGTQAQITSKTPGVSLLDATLVPLGKLDPFKSTSLKVKTSMRAGTPLEVVDLEIRLTNPSFENVVVNVPARYQADEAPDSAANDNVENTKTSWRVSTAGAKDIEWTRTAEGKNHFWTIPNGFQSADNRLISPVFMVDGTQFSLSFKHRWFFRSSRRTGRDVDGGTVELSVDGGKTFKDISTYGVINYNTTLDEQGRGTNPLKGAKAFGGKSTGYPANWVETKVDVTLPAPAEAGLAIRFRAGNGDTFSVTADGWDVDDITLTGIATTPFWAFVPHADNCDPNGPTANAGPAKTAKTLEVVKLEGSATHPADAELTFMWRQVGGPPVKLRDEATATPSFDAPAEPTALAFELRAHDGKLLSAASRVDVAVATPAAAPPKADEGCSCTTTGQAPSTSTAFVGTLVALAALVTRRRRRTL